MIEVCGDVHSEVENEAGDRGHDSIIQKIAVTVTAMKKGPAGFAVYYINITCFDRLNPHPETNIFNTLHSAYLFS